MCVCAFMCVHMYFYAIPPKFLSLPFPLCLYLRHTHTQTHMHVPACRVRVCDRLGVLGVGHPLPCSPSAPSGELAIARGQAATSICLVNTEISKAPPSPQQKIAQARPASAKIACYAESIRRRYLLNRKMWT